MFAPIVALAAVAGVASAAPLAARAQPSSWAAGYLEDYSSYHIRYLALSCQTQHNTTFFDECCHPLLSEEDLDSRPDYCTPTDEECASVSSSLAAPTSTSYSTSGTVTSAVAATASADADAITEYSEAAASATSSWSYVAATSSAAASSTDDNKAAYAQPTTSSTTTSKWHATSTSTAAATTSAASSGGSSENTGGYATYFYQGGNAGACGTVHSDSDYIIAIDIDWYGNTGSVSQYCGKSITVENPANGKTVTATVADVCPSCANSNSLDLSVGAFTAIATEDEGQVAINWWFE